MRWRTLGVSGILFACLTSVVTLRVVAQDAVRSAPARVAVETLQKGFPSSRLYWEGAQLDGLASGSFRLQVTPPTRFTSLAVAWNVDGETPPAEAFRFSFRSRTSSGAWSSPVAGEGETAPDENPSGLYWSNLYMTPGGASNDEVEIVMNLPMGVRLTALQVMSAEILPMPRSEKIARAEVPRALAAGPQRPTIIPRKDWWGSLPPDSLDGHFGPIQITISHAVVHHTAMTNNPPDPPQEIRSIWNLHVYGNGWSDIGYNFLIDQFGNIYQGRYNPWLDSTDVQGAHATSANVKSVGISVLGNFSAAAGGIPDPRALQGLEELIAWRFDQRGLDPLESASIPTNLGGPRVVPRICGHRDVGTTECPGVNLYVLLPAVQTNVKGILTGTGLSGGEHPDGFALYQNFPNPFNPTTVFRYQLAVGSTVKLVVQDVLGREVAVLEDEKREAGVHEVRFDGSRLSSGVYFCRLQARPTDGGQAGEFVQTKRSLLLK